MDRRDLVFSVVQLSYALRNMGVAVTSGQIIDAVRSLALVEIVNQEDFYWALRTNLALSKEEGEKFDAVYGWFFGLAGRDHGEREAADPGEDAGEGSVRVRRQQGEEAEANGLDEDEVETISLEEWMKDVPSEAAFEEGSVLTYSPFEAFVAKDFGQYTEDEIRAARKLARALAGRLALAWGRRKRRSKRRGKIDIGRTLRQGLRTEGELLHLARRQRRLAKARLVVFCDVSGSMEVYTRFALSFLHGLAREVRGVEVFLFATRLTRVTPFLRQWDANTVLGKLHEKVPDWLGGTRIGECLFGFACGLAKNLLTKATVVLILSDGWDVGEIKLLEKALLAFRSRARYVFWLNPLLGSANFEPTCRGMQVATRLAHGIYPFYNLASLAKLVRRLELA